MGTAWDNFSRAVPPALGEVRLGDGLMRFAASEKRDWSGDVGVRLLAAGQEEPFAGAEHGCGACKSEITVLTTHRVVSLQRAARRLHALAIAGRLQLAWQAATTLDCLRSDPLGPH